MCESNSSSLEQSSGLSLEALRAVALGRDDLTQRLLGIYREQGHQEGYLKAVNEMLLSLIQSTEEYLDLHPEDENLRSILYGFVEHLDHRIRGLSYDAGYVEDGLGI